MMECLNDIGAVEFFGVRTLSVGIYATWLGKGNLAGAAQLALVMMLFVIGLIVLEQSGRRMERTDTRASREAAPGGVRLHGIKGFLAMATCGLPAALGFVLPAGVLLSFAMERGGLITAHIYGAAAMNSIMVSLIAAFVILVFGLFIAYAQKLSRSRSVA